MQPPVSLKFDGLECTVDQLLQSKTRRFPTPGGWTRVHFIIPDNYEAPQKVDAWLSKNCPSKWASYNYTDPKNKKHDIIMVVRFESKDDALLFKLRGGHQCWMTGSTAN